MECYKDKTIVEVYIHTESGCNPSEGEYSANITGVFGSLQVGVAGGADDSYLIDLCISENIDLFILPEEGETRVLLVEGWEVDKETSNKFFDIFVADLKPSD